MLYLTFYATHNNLKTGQNEFLVTPLLMGPLCLLSQGRFEKQVRPCPGTTGGKRHREHTKKTQEGNSILSAPVRVPLAPGAGHAEIKHSGNTSQCAYHYTQTELSDERILEDPTIRQTNSVQRQFPA